jgi:hypothetical protein
VPDGGPPPIDGGVVSPKIVFVSSQTLVGNLGGLSGADQSCTNMAHGAGLSGTFKAWLSDATGSPATRFFKSPGPYRLTNGEHIADNWNDLVNGTISAPIDRDERGLPAPSSSICEGGEVWSNTTPAGLPASSMSCGNWTSTTATSSSGSFVYIDRRWSESGCISIGCASDLSIFCFEQ